MLPYTDDELEKDSVLLSHEQWAKLTPYFNRRIYYEDCPKLAGPAVRAITNTKQLEEKFLRDGVVVLDDFLVEEALVSLRSFSLASTIWRYYKCTV